MESGTFIFEKSVNGNGGFDELVGEIARRNAASGHEVFKLLNEESPERIETLFRAADNDNLLKWNDPNDWRPLVRCLTAQHGFERAGQLVSGVPESDQIRHVEDAHGRLRPSRRRRRNQQNFVANDPAQLVLIQERVECRSK